jgi:hypothetical protein
MQVQVVRQRVKVCPPPPRSTLLKYPWCGVCKMSPVFTWPGKVAHARNTHTPMEESVRLLVHTVPSIPQGLLDFIRCGAVTLCEREDDRE